MSKTKFYKKCKLQKGSMHTTSWIPEKYAVLDKYIKLKTAGIWTNDWRVLEVGPRVETDIVHMKKTTTQIS